MTLETVLGEHINAAFGDIHALREECMDASLGTLRWREGQHTLQFPTSERTLPVRHIDSLASTKKRTLKRHTRVTSVTLRTVGICSSSGDYLAAAYGAERHGTSAQD